MRRSIVVRSCALWLCACDREEPVTSASAPAASTHALEDPAAALREAVLPPGAEITGTTHTVDDQRMTRPSSVRAVWSSQNASATVLASIVARP